VVSPAGGTSSLTEQLVRGRSYKNVGRSAGTYTGFAVFCIFLATKTWVLNATVLFRFVLF